MHKSPTDSTRYSTENVYLGYRASEEAGDRHISLVAADWEAVVAIQGIVIGGFPRAQRLRHLDISNSAIVLRLTSADEPRFADASAGQPYAVAKDPQGTQRSISRAPLKRLFGGRILDVTTPSLVDSPGFGAACARGLLEYGGIIKPSDQITGDAERARLAGNPALEVMDEAQRLYRNAIVVVNDPGFPAH